MIMGRVFVSAKTYVKDYGWYKAKEMLNKARGCDSIKVSGYFFLYDDLERLVKSYEFVQGYGGIENARIMLSTEQGEPYYNYNQQLVDHLKQAIADVESCL